MSGLWSRRAALVAVLLCLGSVAVLAQLPLPPAESPLKSERDVRVLHALLTDSSIESLASTCFQTGPCQARFSSYDLGGYRVYDGKLEFDGAGGTVGVDLYYLSSGSTISPTQDRLGYSQTTSTALTSSNMIIADATSYSFLTYALRQDVPEFIALLGSGYEVTYLTATPDPSILRTADTYRVTLRMSRKDGAGQYLIFTADHLGNGAFSRLSVL